MLEGNTRERTGSVDVVISLQNPDIVSLSHTLDSRREARKAGADDQNIDAAVWIRAHGPGLAVVDERHDGSLAAENQCCNSQQANSSIDCRPRHGNAGQDGFLPVTGMMAVFTSVVTVVISRRLITCIWRPSRLIVRSAPNEKSQHDRQILIFETWCMDKRLAELLGWPRKVSMSDGSTCPFQGRTVRMELPHAVAMAGATWAWD